MSNIAPPSASGGSSTSTGSYHGTFGGGPDPAVTPLSAIRGTLSRMDWILSACISNEDHSFTITSFGPEV